MSKETVNAIIEKWEERSAFVAELSFDFMFGRVRDYVSDLFDVPPAEAALMLIDFEGTHGKDSILSLYGFLRYVANEYDPEEREKMIRQTIAHDLNGRKDSLMSPQTADYWRFANI